MLDLSKRTAVDLRAVAESHNDAIVECPSPAEKPRKVPAPDAEPVLTHKVAYSDIDFNRHVNTMRYIEMMLDVLPIERFAEERPLRLDINFLKEARYGQTLSVALEARGSQTLVEIRSVAYSCRGRILRDAAPSLLCGAGGSGSEFRCAILECGTSFAEEGCA